MVKAYEWKKLTKLLSSDTVPKVLNAKLIDEYQGPVSIPAIASNILHETYGIINLLHEYGFVAQMVKVKRPMQFAV